MAQEDDLLASLDELLGEERPTEKRPPTHGLKEAFGYPPGAQAIGSSIAQETETVWTVRDGHPRQGSSRCCHVAHVGGGHAVPQGTAAGVGLLQDQDVLGVLVGERSEQDRIHSTEHGGGGAYAQSKREHRHRGETRRFAQDPDGVAHVLPNSLHGRFPPDVSRPFLDGVHAADLDARRANGRLAGEAGCHLLFDGSLQVGAELLVHVPFHLCLVEQTPEPADDAAKDQHHSSPSEARRILVIAAVCASQSRVARLSVARPSGVML